MEITITLITLLIIALFFLIRNFYTYKCRLRAIDIIFNYQINNRFMSDIYEKMMMSYSKHFLSIWKWGKYSAIKNEYKEILKPYMD